VTIVILLIFVVLLWVAVLAPSAWRRFGERQGVGSIDHFHHQLQLLEHAGPKTVPPAYRLYTAVPGGRSPESAADLAVDSSRPKLVLLRPTDDAAAADVDGNDGLHYERVGVLDRPEPVCLPEVGRARPSFHREQARRRCTVLLRALGGVAIVTGLLGLVPGMQMVWVLTGLAGLAALGVVGLMAYAKELEAEQARRRSHRAFLDRARQVDDPASAGYPGAWDEDDFEVPRVASH
jgi:membrane protein implicated in regulation of membrane protease activity